MREIIFDTETTGLSAANGDRIIEIGAIEMVNRFPTGRTFHEYLNPGSQPIHPDAQAVHGISAEDLADKPSFSDIVPKFQEFFADGTLIAHNAKFDIGFFDAELKRVGLPVIDPNRVVDTLVIARRKFPGGRNSLDALCSRFGISNAHRTLHGALLDSELLADVYIELTGGRQTGLSLDEAPSETSSSGQGGGQSAQSARQRPNPRSFTLTENEKKAHGEMIESMGETALWNRWTN